MADGELTRLCAGKTIDVLACNDKELHIMLTSGQTVVVAWRDDQNNILPGNPCLERVDCTVKIL